MAKDKEGASMKHCREQQSVDKPRMDSTKIKSCGKKQDFTPAKTKLDFSQRVTGYREEDSIIPTFSLPCSGAEENKIQYRDQQLMVWHLFSSSFNYYNILICTILC